MVDPGELPVTLSPGLRKLLARIGIHRRDDLLLHLPLRYEDETTLTPFDRLSPGSPQQIEGEIVSCRPIASARPMWLVSLSDGQSTLIVRFFQLTKPQAATLIPGQRLRCYGDVTMGYQGLEMTHPRYRLLHRPEPLPTALTAVYPSTNGLAQSALRKLIGRRLAAAELTDTVTAPGQLGQFTLAECLRCLHAPPPDCDRQALAERWHPWWQRVKFEELLAQQLSMQQARNDRQAMASMTIHPVHDPLSPQLLTDFGHPLTAGQAQALADIVADMAQPHPMYRLLQGDVGCGKTIVAALAACRVIAAGMRVALMAPTEILAEQHLQHFSHWFEPLGVTVKALLGKRGKKRPSHAEAALVIGTHALIQHDVELPGLGLVIIDEQHRFGVMQRLLLKEKGHQPHLLMLSATPIPRSLAMSIYADLDVSSIRELPPGRTPVRTYLKAETSRDEVLRYALAQIRAGCQVYWVCPLIEESEALQLETAEATYTSLCESCAELAPEVRLGLIHGRLKKDAKDAVMTAFYGGDVQLLVSTTVIEVGVNVPSASVMVIENAERFGLAQLHQLRGRVGRGTAKSACILLYQTPLSATARERLKTIYEHHDGFTIAQEDLRLRGPGELLGSRQSGEILFRYADLAHDLDLLAAAQASARQLWAERPDLAERHIERWLPGRRKLLLA